MRAGMPVYVAEERLLASVHHLDGPARAQREQADVHLEAHVFAGAERAADTGERQAHLFERQREARGDLALVDVQPLRRDVELHSCAVVIGHGEAGFGSEKGLILHSDFVEPLDDDRADRVGIAVPDADVAEEIAVGVDGRCLDRRFRIRQRCSGSYSTRIAATRATRGVGMVGGDRRDRFARVADDVAARTRAGLGARGRTRAGRAHRRP